MQHELTQCGPLLDKRGELTEAGWSSRELKTYCRAAVHGGGARLWERDEYFISNGRIALLLSVEDSGHGGSDFIAFADLEHGRVWEAPKLRRAPSGRAGLPACAERGDVASGGKGYAVLFRSDGRSRILTCHADALAGGESLDAHLMLTDAPAESLCVAAPLSGAVGAFCYGRGIGPFRAFGEVRHGEAVFQLESEDSFACMGWMRALLPPKAEAFWGQAAGIVKGAPFGFQIGCGLGSTHATENAFFYEGKLHKLGEMRLQAPHQAADGGPWSAVSDDGCLTLEFHPLPGQEGTRTQGGCRRIFGLYNGIARPEDGKTVFLNAVPGYAQVRTACQKT